MNERDIIVRKSDLTTLIWIRRATKILLLVLVFTAVYFFFALHLDHDLTIPVLKEREAFIRECYETSPALVIALYAAGTILYVVCSLPGAAIPMMIGGALFGRWTGTVACSISLSIGAILSLLLSRFVFRDFVRRRFAKQAVIVETEYHRNGSNYLVAMRLIPVMPYFITNLVFGLTPISPSRFWVISFFSSMPAIFLYASAGTELSKVNSLGEILSARLIWTLLGLATLPFIGQFLTKRWSRKTERS